MTAPAEKTPAPQAASAVSLISALGIVSAICGVIIVGAYLATLERAKANRRLAAERAVFKVLPGAKSVREFYALPSGEIAPVSAGDAPPGAIKFYSAYDAGGKFAGVAAEGAAKGYADTVRVMFGYGAACQCIVGLGVVSMRETPGIGDKILTDKEFLANFKALDVKLKADLSALANEVRVVKHGTKTQPWQIDAISGATVTSRAVGKGINEAAEALLPRLVPKLGTLEIKP